MLNVAIIAGRLGSSVELRYTKNGTPCASFSLAVDRDYKNDAGEKGTDWLDIVCYRHTAEIVSQYGEKGSLLIVDGRLTVRRYDEDKDGRTRQRVEILADRVYFGSRMKVKDMAESAESSFSELAEDDSDLPF